MRASDSGSGPVASPETPFDGLDYGDDCKPSTAAIGPLALALRDLTGVSGLIAVAATTLIDQGRVTEACQLMAAELEERRAEAEAAKERATERRRRGVA